MNSEQKKAPAKIFVGHVQDQDLEQPQAKNIVRSPLVLRTCTSSNHHVEWMNDLQMAMSIAVC